MSKKISLLRKVFNPGIVILMLISLTASLPTAQAKAEETPIPPTATIQVSTLVVVNNTSDVVDGDVSSIAALLAHPGPDKGISFREAVLASNNTGGPKTISFEPQLAGTAIKIQPAGAIMFLSGGDLTIDGDSNQDGKPDISLDGQEGKPGSAAAIGLAVTSSNVTIRNLTLLNFHGMGIAINCADEHCGSGHFENVQILTMLSNPMATGSRSTPWD